MALQHKLRMLLEEIREYRECNAATQEEICSLFTAEQVERAINIDCKRGYNMNCIDDCVQALNALPDREKRILLKRIDDRINSSYQMKDPREAFEQMKGGKGIFNPNFEPPKFTTSFNDLTVLGYSFIGEHLRSRQTTKHDEKEVVCKVVREFCPDLADDDP